MRLRGSGSGALETNFLHSPVTRALWYAVEEIEHLFPARLVQAGMLASLYSHHDADFEKGGSHTHEAYISALNVIPYLNLSAHASAKGSTDALVEEWRRINEGQAAKSTPSDQRKEASDADR